MLPNKTAASILVGLLVVQLLVGVADAQLPTPPQADVIVESVDVGSPRIAGVPARVNISVRNIGGADFNPAGGWQIFVGLDERTRCIEPGDDNAGSGAVPDFAAPCRIRMVTGAPQPADGTNQTAIPKGTAKRYTFIWNATSDDVNDTARVYVEILSLQQQPGEASSNANCNGPDAPNCQNNLFTLFGVVIGELGVRAIPVRAKSPTGDDLNTGWKRSEITEACPVPDAHVERGCKVRAGRTIVAHYTITNTGTVDDAYVATFPDNQTLVTAYNLSVSPAVVTLGRRQETVVKVSIVVPESEAAEKGVNVDFASEHVRWTSVRSPLVTTASKNPGCEPGNDEYCKDPTLPSFVVDFRRGLNATSNETWRQIIAGVPAQFNITLNNTGNAPDEYNVSYVKGSGNIDDNWTVNVVNVSGRFVPQAGLANVTVQVRAPPTAANGTYKFDVLMKSRGDDGTSRCKANEIPAIGQCTLTFTAHVGQTWAMAGASDADVRTVPGELATYHLGIRNEGNGYDNVSLDLQSTQAGWDVRLSERVLHLTPGNTSAFTLTALPPPGTIANTKASFFVNATASGPIETPFEARAKVSIESKLTVISGPNMRIDVPSNSSFVDAGSSAAYDLIVTNVGNLDDNFTIPTPERPSDWGVTVEPNYAVLKPNEQASVRVTLRAPNGATVGERASATVKVVSSVESTREKSVTLEGRVSGPDLFVDSVLVNATSPYHGDPLEISVVLGNNGNKPADKNVTLRVVYVHDNVEQILGEKVYKPLEIPGQRRLVETFAWDTKLSQEGAGVLVARIDATNVVPEIDDSPASNERSRPLTLRTFEIKLTPAAGLTMRPGETRAYDESPNVFIVEYRGNQAQEPVTIRLESEHGWLDGQSELSLALPSRTPIPITPKINVPTTPGTAKDVLTITVIPALRPSEVLRASTTTTVLDEENPRVTRITVTPAAAKLGDPVSIDVHVEDATGVSAVTAYVTTPTNETQQVVLAQAAPGRWNATRAFTVAGSYRVSADAADAVDPPNRNRTRDLTTAFTIAPGSAPTIKLAEGQTTTIRTGSLIKLDIRDPLGVGKASYSIKGVSYDMRPGFLIDTSTFPPGTVDVVVTAENIYGVTTSQKFTFTVDNTPPATPRITLNPERPRANEDVTITIATEPGVSGVDVLIKRDGQVTQSLNATRKGAGSFEVKFNPGEGDYRIDVTTRDEAGNAKVQESAVVFSARPGSAVPAGGLLVVVLVMGAIALVLRRRR